MSEMQNVWQQAEHNSGSLDEAVRMVRNLRDHLTGGNIEPFGGDKAKPDLPTRVGLLGVLDSQARDILYIKSMVSDLMVFIGEPGAAPVNATTDNIASGVTARQWSR